MLDSLFSGLGSIIGSQTSGKGGAGKLDQIYKLYRDLQEPDFDFSKLTAPELKLVAEVMPEVYEAVVPDEFKMIEDSPARADQLSALSQLDQVSREGLPLEDKIMAQKAQDKMAAEGSRLRSAITDAFRQRGRAGGGTELAAQFAGSQQGHQLAADMANDLSLQAIRNRMAAVGDKANLASAIRGQDVAVSQSNADTQNRLATLISSMKTQARQDAARERARAQTTNAMNRQSMANQNTLNRYNTDADNLDRRNALEGSKYNARLQKLGGMAGALTNIAELKELRRAQRIKDAENAGGAIGSIADLAILGI
jgi:hypothetical protein